MGQPDTRLARDVETALMSQPGVSWAQVNGFTGRVVVSYDDAQTDAERLVGVIANVEEAHGLADVRFGHDRPDHPADIEPLHRQWYALGADAAGLGLSVVGRLARANPLLSGVASLVSLVDGTPVLRRPIEGWLGPAAADLGLAVGNAVAQGLAQGPLGLVVDTAHRYLRLDELVVRRRLWERREPVLASQPAESPSGARMPVPRPVALPAGPVETYSSNAAAGAISAAAATALTRDPQLVVAAAATANPKAARLGREAFAARLGRDLGRSGVLAMDVGALRRLDRVDTVVLDAQVLATGAMAVASVWLPPGARDEAEEALLAAHALISLGSTGSGSPPGGTGTVALPGQATWPGGAGPAGAMAGALSAAVVAHDGGWAAGPVPAALPGGFAAAARSLRAPGTGLLALWRDGGLSGLVVVEPELDALAGPLTAAARRAGQVVLAGHSGTGQQVRPDRIVAGGTATAESVRALQSEGAVVALVSACQHEALAAADVGIGVPSGPAQPWGAHLITEPGLTGACRILQAVPAARAASRRAVKFAAYGSGAGAVLALTGPRRAAATRSLFAVNSAALASLSSGVWSAITLAHRPPPAPAAAMPWHALTADAVLARLGSSGEGLTGSEASMRMAARPDDHGPAEPGVIRAALEELANPLTPVLAGGAGLAAAVGSFTDAALIGALVGANTLVSGVQRVSVSRALRRLIDKSAVRVRVLRSGQEELTTAEQLVAGDVILLQAGDAVPADCRILQARGLETDESSLTGESQLVAKDARPTGAANLAERTSMLYAGTSIAAGAATAAVVAVGAATELGRSARAAEDRQRPGGVQARLHELTRQTVPLTLGAGAAMIGAGLLRGHRVRETVGTAVSLAVAAVPEGLPIVATAAQYSAARRLSRRNVLVRSPGTIEALGRVDVLCFDKTGTLTRGKIRLQRVWTPRGGEALDELTADGRRVLAIGLRATPVRQGRGRLPHATDRAVTKGAKTAGVATDLGAGRWRQVCELPFEPTRGYHAVLGETADGHRLAVKGAPEIVMPMCTRQRLGDRIARLDEPARQLIAGECDRLARSGYRVLAVAERDAASRADLSEDHVGRLCFAGLLALADPARDAAARAIRGLRAARVDVMMITGDHPSTAEAIAAEIGLLNGHRVVTGQELDAASDAELGELAEKAAVFARVSPDHKVRIVAALRRAGRVVAVTGDGANDAAAIRLADVGIALGKRGTNAAKDAADIIVTDDRIETITEAIAEGRAMWSSVRAAIAMLLGGNLGEIAFTLGAGLLLPGGSPLNARQLLLVNLFTDMVPSLALAVQAPTSATTDVLLREGPDVSLGAALTRDIVIRGGLTASAGAVAWIGGRLTGVTQRRAGTVALVGIVGAQLGQTLQTGWRSPLVVIGSLGSAAALAGVIQTPGVSHFFGCTPLGPVGWGVGLSAAAAASLGAPLVATLIPWRDSLNYPDRTVLTRSG